MITKEASHFAKARYITNTNMNKPIFEIVTTSSGAISIRNNHVNEIMHNPVGPWIEANALYVEQSNLKKCLLEDSPEPVILFDVGLGAGSNAVAALTCAQKNGNTSRALHIISFERDLELLKFTLDNAQFFNHLNNYKSILNELLSTGHWSDGKNNWDLHSGDFLKTIEHISHRPHIIFFDPYSPDVNSDMWTVDCFRKIYEKCRTQAEGSTVLYTYSVSTRVRAALLFVGFHVGHGLATGLKKETTAAATALDKLQCPLTPAWFGRWYRSSSRYPCDSTLNTQLQFDEFMESYVREHKIIIPPRKPANRP